MDDKRVCVVLPVAIKENSDLNLVDIGTSNNFKAFQVHVINELKLLAPGEEDKRLKSRETKFISCIVTL